MKIASIVLLMCCAVSGVTAQVNKQIDSLKRVISLEKIDSQKVKQYYALAKQYEVKKDSQSIVSNYIRGIDLAKKINSFDKVVFGFNEIALYFLLNSSFQSSSYYIEKAISFEKQKNVTEEIGRSFFIRGNIYNALRDFNNAIENFNYAKSFFIKSGNNKRIGNTYQNLGNCYFAKNDFEKALECYYKAIEFYEKAGEEKSKGSVIMNVGVINYTQKNYDIAISFFNKAKIIAEKNNDLIQLLNVNTNIAGIFHGQKKFDKAIVILLENLKLNEKVKNKKVESASINTLASCYERIGDSLNAEIYLARAIEIAKKDNDKESILINYNNYAGVLSGTNRLDEAIRFGKEALEIANQYTEFLKYKPGLYNSLSRYYDAKNDYKSAFQYKDSQYVYKELLINETSNNKLLELQTKYETVQKETKINLLSKADSIKSLQITNQQLAINKSLFELSQQQLALAEDSILLFTQNETILQNKLDASLKEEKINTLTKEGLQKQLALQQQQAAIKQKNNTIIIIAIAAILLLVIAYAFYRKKQLQQQAFMVQEQAKQRELITKAVIDAEEAERKRIASDLHDGVGQLFSAVKMNLAGLIDRIDLPKEEDQFLAEKTLALVDESCKEVRVISHKMMPNFLLKSGIASDIRSFIEKIDESTLKIHFETKGFKEQLEFNEEVILYRVIQELIGNVIKHAQANELFLHLEKTNKQIQVQVTDNGLGFNYDNAIAKGGLGLKNILVRIEYLKGTISFTPNQPTGTIVKINIPLA